ncbi:CoA transferase [Herbaspirillum sp. NPDC087042]|uniref:CoA transferase n=1 Tax=Herbaspirillum sp. NPDC087042 TaxID=3364004 RepID=UPI0037FF111C
MSAHTDEHTAAPHHAMLARIWSALDGAPELLAAVRLQGEGGLPSVFATSDLAQASVAAAGLALAEFMQAAGAGLPAVQCDRRLASMWFSSSLRAQGWTPPALWDSVAGDYRSADGWIRLHTNAPHHRAAALQVLDLDPQRATREEVAQAVQRWNGTALESAIVANGGCAAEMRSQAQWALHPQGAAVAAEPLVAWQAWDAGARPLPAIDAARPLAGIRVLDLTRVLAGPTATRLLAGFGAEVLRIDPASWDEPGVVPEMTLGKRCAHLALDQPADRALLEGLLAQADVLVHGYRPQALEQLGLGVARRRELNPALVDVSLDAYGWSGPWAGRRGFDSLVQMSSGIAHTGMQRRGASKPVPLPVQALDHATGYVLAAAALRGLSRRQLAGKGSQARLSLARTARLLADYPLPEGSDEAALDGEVAADFDPAVERTVWGPAHRLLAPLQVAGAPLHWDLPASPLRASPARWRA